MRVIRDTNVFVSSASIAGPPCRLLEAWRDGKLQSVLSREILEEYQRVGETLAEQFSGVNPQPVIDLVTAKAEIFPKPILPEPICDDPDDDKFISCALASGCGVIVSGNKHLLKPSGSCIHNPGNGLTNRGLSGSIPHEPGPRIS